MPGREFPPMTQGEPAAQCVNAIENSARGTRRDAPSVEETGGKYFESKMPVTCFFARITAPGTGHGMVQTHSGGEESFEPN